MPSSHQDAWRPLAPAQVCPSSALQTALGRSLCSYGEQSSSPAGSPSPGSPRLSFAPQTSRAFKSQSSESKKKFQFQPSPVSPAPCLPATLDPNPGQEAGAAGGQGCSSPGFSPGPSCSPGCLEILESFLEGERASQARLRAPPAGPVQAGAHTPGGQGRAFGSPVFSKSCETVSHCFQYQPFQLSPQIQPTAVSRTFGTQI